MKKLYIVTEAAAPMTDIAGQRKRPGAEIELTDREAQFEKLRGVIAPAPPAKPVKPRRRR